MSPSRGSLRVWRGLGLAAACLAVPLLGHVGAGGHVPGFGPFALVAGILAGACVAISDRQQSAAGIAGLMLLTQPALHALFTLSGHGAAASIVPSASMVIAHVVAGAVLTVLLAGAESVIWALASLLSTILLTSVRALLSTRPRAAQAGTTTCAPEPTGTVVTHIRETAPTRGPPAVPVPLA